MFELSQVVKVRKCFYLCGINTIDIILCGVIDSIHRNNTYSVQLLQRLDSLCKGYSAIVSKHDLFSIDKEFLCGYFMANDTIFFDNMYIRGNKIFWKGDESDGKS